ncbi:MAG: hypothetical protein ACRDLA_16325, partial [Thermoleophilaceae bacterium]
MFRFPASGDRPTAVAERTWLDRVGLDRLAAVLVGAVLAGVVFGAAGGTTLGRTVVVEILMVLCGGTVVAAAVVWGRPGRLHGGGALLLFAGLVGLTALSVTWAIVPELAYVEAGRTLAYL